MKTHSMIRPLLAAAGVVLAGIGSADAGLVYDTSVFTTADIDISGGLSSTEFNTTLDAGLSERAQARFFRRSDANRNGSIEGNEWLIFDGQIVSANKFEQSFFRGMSE